MLSPVSRSKISRKSNDWFNLDQSLGLHRKIPREHRLLCWNHKTGMEKGMFLKRLKEDDPAQNYRCLVQPGVEVRYFPGRGAALRVKYNKVSSL